jgi:hypothetical protein
MRTSILLLSVLAATGSAAPTAKWTIRQRVATGDKLHYVAIGEVDRSGVLTPIAAPELDKISDDAAAAWKTYKPAASIKVTERHANSVSMGGPDEADHTFTFTAKEPLYHAAALRAFADANGLVLSGLGVNFMAFDEHDPPKGTYDGAITYDHFRKSKDTLKFGKQGYVLGFLERSLRTQAADELDAQRWISASDPKVSLERDSSSGELTVAWVKLYADGHVEYKPMYARDLLAQDWQAPYTAADVEVSTYDHDAFTMKKIAKASPTNLEAMLVERLVHYAGYDIDPAIDVAKLK